MPTIANTNVPTPKSWDEFEDIALSAAKLRWGSSEFFRNGRQGQRQDGVDVFGTDNQSRQIGIQGKNTIDGVSKGTIEAEIKRAESFQPPLDLLCIATTAKRDVVLQKAVRLLSRKRTKARQFSVEIFFWDDICQDIAKDEAVFFKHYPQFRPKSNAVLDHDKALFGELSKLLSSNGVIGFIDQHNMQGFAFPYAKLDPLREFYYEWNKPEREFITPEVEAAKKALWSKTDDYLEIIAAETYPLDTNVDWHSVPAEWEVTQPDRFWRVTKQLHSLAGDIVALHGALVRTAKACLVGKPVGGTS